MNPGGPGLSFVHNAAMDDLTQANADAERAMEELLALQAKLTAGDVSIELIMALAKATYALKSVMLAQLAGSLRIKPSTFDQMVSENSTAWAAPEQPAVDAPGGQRIASATNRPPHH